MPRLRYTRERIPYHGSNPIRPWRQGDEDEVPEPEATRLVETFPDWFERAEETTVTEKPAEEAPAAPAEAPKPPAERERVQDRTVARGVAERITKPARGREK